MDYENISKVLEVYTLEELLELSEVSPEEATLFLLEQEIIKLPEYCPIDLEDD